MMMRASALLVAIAAAVAFTAPSLLAQNDADRKDWTQLFNGTNLDGWTVKITGHEPGDNFGDTFRVQDGKLAVSYDKYGAFDGQFGHIFYRGTWSYYRIAVEYRFVGEQAKGGQRSGEPVAPAEGDDGRPFVQLPANGPPGRRNQGQRPGKQSHYSRPRSRCVVVTVTRGYCASFFDSSIATATDRCLPPVQPTAMVA